MTTYDGAVPLPINLLVPAAYDSPSVDYGTYIDVPNSNLAIVRFAYNSGTVQHQYQFVNSLNWTRGAHGVKFGADLRRLAPTYNNGTYSSSADIESLSDIQQGNATYLYVDADEPGQPVFDNLSLYAQDHWKIHSNLSLDYGLRWDFNPPPGPSNGFYPVALTSDNLTSATLVSSNIQPYQTDYHAFAPRLGFAWNAIPAHAYALTVRGGFGFFYDTAQQVIGEEYAALPPFGSSRTETEVAMPLSGAALAPAPISDTLTTPYPSVVVMSPSLTAPYTEQWNFSIDEALNPRNTLTFSYVGNEGKKLLFTQYYNKIAGNSNFTSLHFTSNAASSNYNAFQVQDFGRIVSGLNIVASFTWAHALDNSSSDYSSYAPIYGNSNNDLRKVINLALNYQSTSVGSNRWIQSITRGWALANRFSAESGFPVTNINESTTYVDGVDTQYLPDLVPGVPIYLHGSAAIGSVHGWKLNRAAFACTTTGATIGACTGTPTQEGTLGRNYVRDPALWTLNSSVQRDFPLYEQLHLNFRADAFNILNHPSVTGPNTTLSSATFGELIYGEVTTIGSQNQLYAMGAARSLQFSLKLQF
jgi:hypothetical protein